MIRGFQTPLNTICARRGSRSATVQKSARSAEFGQAKLNFGPCGRALDGAGRSGLTSQRPGSPWARSIYAGGSPEACRHLESIDGIGVCTIKRLDRSVGALRPAVIYMLDDQGWRVVHASALTHATIFQRTHNRHRPTALAQAHRTGQHEAPRGPPPGGRHAPRGRPRSAAPGGCECVWGVDGAPIQSMGAIESFV